MGQAAISCTDRKPPGFCRGAPSDKEAQEAYSVGIRANPKAPVFYIQLSRLQEQMDAVVKLRSTLDRARSQIPNDTALWSESVRLERRQSNISFANKVMVPALQEVPVPNSGLLWAEKIVYLEARRQRKPRALEAIKKVEDPLLFVVIARIFWSKRRLEKAKTWFQKAIVLDPDYGDAYV
jgi:pre-mRNA-processing factor 6